MSTDKQEQMKDLEEAQRQLLEKVDWDNLSAEDCSSLLINTRLLDLAVKSTTLKGSQAEQTEDE